MNNKGFTLVELLAVIVILSLLVLLASTSVTNIVRDSKSDLYDTQIELIKSAAETWGADNLYRLPDAGECKYMTLKTLKEYGLLDSSIENPKNHQEFDDNMKIKIIGQETKYGTTNIIYEVDSNDISGCKNVYPVCQGVTKSNASYRTDDSTTTIGNIPTGTYSKGDEYICEVKQGVKYNFFVLSETDTKVNLILDRNITSDGGLTSVLDFGDTCWINDTDYGCEGTYCATNGYGPVSALNFLNTATDNWTYLDEINESYTDEGDNDWTINLTGYARLPKKEEITTAGCTSSGSCPLWLTNYLYQSDSVTGGTNITNIWGYWLLSSVGYGSDQANIVDYTGILSTNDMFDEDGYGVRPVISVSKENIDE